jgi:catechol 2,3-dioxygenase-like lactoylglutathione lyase family enzyme
MLKGGRHTVPTLREATTMTQLDTVLNISPRSGNGSSGRAEIVDMKLEVIVVPVSDVGRARCFYEMMGFRLDADYAAGEDFRVVQLTPPGSECSIIIGNGITSAAPGSVQGLYLVVFDIEAARAELVGRGIDVGEVFHDVGGVFHHAGTAGRAAGPDPEHRDYGSFAAFSDPDGNGWFLQEVKVRAPGR